MKIVFFSQDKALESLISNLSMDCCLVNTPEEVKDNLSDSSMVVFLDIDEKKEEVLELCSFLNSCESVLTVIISSDLSVKELRVHQRSDNAVDGYLQKPLTVEIVKNILSDFELSATSTNVNLGSNELDFDIEEDLEEDDYSALEILEMNSEVREEIAKHRVDDNNAPNFDSTANHTIQGKFDKIIERSSKPKNSDDPINDAVAEAGEDLDHELLETDEEDVKETHIEFNLEAEDQKENLDEPNFEVDNAGATNVEFAFSKEEDSGEEDSGFDLDDSQEDDELNIGASEENTPVDIGEETDVFVSTPEPSVTNDLDEEENEGDVSLDKFEDTSTALTKIYVEEESSETEEVWSVDSKSNSHEGATTIEGEGVDDDWGDLENSLDDLTRPTKVTDSLVGESPENKEMSEVPEEALESNNEFENESATVIDISLRDDLDHQGSEQDLVEFEQKHEERTKIIQVEIGNNQEADGSTDPTILSSHPLQEIVADTNHLGEKNYESYGKEDEEKTVIAPLASFSSKERINEVENSPGQAPVSSHELIRTQATIRQLRDEREKLLKKIESVDKEKEVLTQGNLGNLAELDEARIEIGIMTKRYSDELDEARKRASVSVEKMMIYEEKMKNYQRELDRISTELRFDFNKVKSRERELVNQVELMTMDSEAQVKSRDLKILELKRKIDSLEFNMQNVAIKEEKTRNDKDKLQERLDTIMRTLRSSIKLLEDDLDLGKDFIDKIDKL